MKKLKMIASVILCIVLSNVQVFGSDSVNISFRLGEDTIRINGESKKIERLELVEGTTVVPLRVIVEGFGAEIAWEGNTKTVTIKEKNKIMILQIDSLKVSVDGEIKTLLAAPKLVNNTTMVPLRFISENFGAEVSYNENTKDIQVKREKKIEELKLKWISAYKPNLDLNSNFNGISSSSAREVYAINLSSNNNGTKGNIVSLDVNNVLEPKEKKIVSRDNISFTGIAYKNNSFNIFWDEVKFENNGYISQYRPISHNILNNG